MSPIKRIIPENAPESKQSAPSNSARSWYQVKHEQTLLIEKMLLIRHEMLLIEKLEYHEKQYSCSHYCLFRLPWKYFLFSYRVIPKFSSFSVLLLINFSTTSRITYFFPMRVWETQRPRELQMVDRRWLKYNCAFVVTLFKFLQHDRCDHAWHMITCNYSTWRHQRRMLW